MTSNVQLLKWMMQDVRNELLKGIEGLSKEKLFQAPAEGEFPIGAYLMHLAECTAYWYSQLTGKEMPEELRKRAYDNCWFDCPKENYNPPESPVETEEYLEVMEETQRILFDYMDKMKDDELDENVILKRKSDNIVLSKKWILYHLLEHEAHHRGQIFMLIRQAKLK